VQQIEPRVETVNYQDRTVVVTGPDGNQVKLSVDERVQDFDAVKAGDTVVVRYTEAVAMTMIRQWSSASTASGDGYRYAQYAYVGSGSSLRVLAVSRHGLFWCRVPGYRIK
jgi:hypothetical protein